MGRSRKVKARLGIRSSKVRTSALSTVTVVGTGGFGAWAAVFAARSGARKLILINPTGMSSRGTSEDIEEREISIGPYNRRHLGMSKTRALREVIRAARSDARVEIHERKYVPGQHGRLLKGVVFAGVSNAETLKGIWKDAKERGLKCFGGAYRDANFGVFTAFPSGLEVGDGEPAWVGSAAAAGLLAVHAATIVPFNYYGPAAGLKTERSSFARRLKVDRPGL